MEDNNLLLHKQKAIIESVGLMLGIGLGGAAIGSLMTKGLGSYRNRIMSCKLIKDPYRRDQCTVKIIGSIIDTLKDARDGCDQSADPAQCKYALVQKIDKLLRKKYRLQAHIDRVYRNKIVDGEVS